jgi:hypothetical protein
VRVLPVPAANGTVLKRWLLWRSLSINFHAALSLILPLAVADMALTSQSRTLLA